MTTHLSDDQIRQYRQRLLSGADLLAASSHIAGCDACRARLVPVAEMRQAVAGFRRKLHVEADAAEHLTYDDIAGYVDGTLGREEASRVKMHTRQCEACATDLREVETMGASRTRSFWHSLFPTNARVLVPAAAVCALAVLVFIRGPSNREEGQSTRSEPAPAPSTTTPVAPPPESREVIRDGDRVLSIAGGGVVTGLETLASPYREMVEGAMKAEQIQPPKAVADLIGTTGVLLGTAAETAAVGLRRPIGTSVETDRPVLAWTSQPEAEYLVSLYDEQYTEVAASGWIRRAEWQVPRPLRRAARYSWQVTVRRDGRETTVPVPPAPEARFRVISTNEQQELEEVRRAQGGSHLLLALVYVQAGLLDDAERELAALVKANPQSRVAAALAASVERFRYKRPPIATKPAQ